MVIQIILKRSLFGSIFGSNQPQPVNPQPTTQPVNNLTTQPKQQQKQQNTQQKPNSTQNIQQNVQVNKQKNAVLPPALGQPIQSSHKSSAANKDTPRHKPDEKKILESHKQQQPVSMDRLKNEAQKFEPKLKTQPANNPLPKSIFGSSTEPVVSSINTLTEVSPLMSPPVL